MSFDAALRLRLIDWADLTALSPDIRWTRSEQGDGPNRIVLRRVSDLREQHLKGLTDARSTRVQADCWARTREDALTLAEAVLAAVEQPAAVGDVRMTLSAASGPLDFSESVAGVFEHRQTVDLTIWHDG